MRVLRGGRLESLHRVIAAAADERGRVLAARGDPRRRIFVRSAAKPFQAMPLLEAGGERAFGLGDEEIALLCASHGGEPRHVRVAARLLARGGFTEADLACGAQRPLDPRSADAVASRGERASVLHNNCSGKHAGMLLACRLYGYSPRGYWEASHPLQREVLRRIALYFDVPASRLPTAIDGCSLPVFLVPLASLAAAYARFLGGKLDGEPREAAAARRRIVAAMTSRPDMVAGRARFTTEFLEAGRGRWIGKEGAEGVYAVGLRASARTGGRAVGLALKVADGSTRPRDAATLALLDALRWLPKAASDALARHRDPLICNAAGLVVGRIETAARPRSP